MRETASRSAALLGAMLRHVESFRRAAEEQAALVVAMAEILDELREVIIVIIDLMSVSCTVVLYLIAAAETLDKLREIIVIIVLMSVVPLFHVQLYCIAFISVCVT